MIRASVPFLLILVGCGYTPPPKLKVVAAPALGNSGWTAASDAETGVSLALPPGWSVGVPKVLDASALMSGSVDLEAAGGPAQEMGTALMNEEAAHQKESLAKLRKEGIVLHCTDGSKATPAEEPTRIYVKQLKDADYGTLEDAVAAEKSDAHRSMKSETVDLPVGKAVRLQAKGRNRIGDEECHVSYVLVDGADAYVLRFASTNNPSAILSVDRSVAQSFRVAKK